MYKFFDSVYSLKDYLKTQEILQNFSEQELFSLSFPNIFCIRENCFIDMVSRDEIQRFNNYCEDMWK